MDRQSLVYFVVPDEDKLVACLSGSDKYPPVYPMQYNYENTERVNNKYNKSSRLFDSTFHADDTTFYINTIISMKLKMFCKHCH